MGDYNVDVDMLWRYQSRILQAVVVSRLLTRFFFNIAQDARGGQGRENCLMRLLLPAQRVPVRLEAHCAAACKGIELQHHV